MKAAMHIRVILLLMVSMFIILIGQAGRELLPPDDLREVEIAREVSEGGDYIIPHLAGLPFVEKPSGFPAVVATIFKVIGGPSADAARFTAAAFALTSITAVFLLGWQIVGVEGGAFAAAILVLSQRFCRTAHEVLLDNALTAFVMSSLTRVMWIRPPQGNIMSVDYHSTLKKCTCHAYSDMCCSGIIRPAGRW